MWLRSLNGEIKDSRVPEKRNLFPNHGLGCGEEERETNGEHQLSPRHKPTDLSSAGPVSVLGD